MATITDPSQSRLGVFNKRSARIGLILLSLLVAILAMPLADFFVCDYLIFDYTEYIRQALIFPVYLFSGLGSLGVLAGWLMYLIISSMAILLNRSERLFWMLYAIFAFLLSVNVSFILIFTLSIGRSFGYTC
jgi:hypothetical protein